MNKFLLIPLGVAAACVVFEYWPRSKAARFQRGYGRFLDDARNRGLSAEQTSDEYQFRHAMARLRQRASLAAIEWPAGHAQKIAQIAAEEAAVLKLRSPSVAKRFLDVVNKAPLSDILYGDALNAVVKAKLPVEHTVTDVDIAAVTTR